jgi:hypothetical protein
MNQCRLAEAFFPTGVLRRRVARLSSLVESSTRLSLILDGWDWSSIYV